MKKYFILIFSLCLCNMLFIPNINAMQGEKQSSCKEDSCELLLKASASGDLQGVKGLIKNGADINAGDSAKLAPLHLAVLYGRFEVVKYILEKGADIKVVCKTGNIVGVTVLHLIVESSFIKSEEEQVKILKLLLENGAADIINAQNGIGLTPLHLAVIFEEVEIVKCLLKNRANNEILDKHWRNPLFYAKNIKDKKTQSEMVLLLTRSDSFSIWHRIGKSINNQGPEFFSKIGCSSCGEYKEKLLRCGGCKKVFYCSVECQRKDWKQHKKSCVSVTNMLNNSLIKACAYGRLKEVKELVEKGANFNVKDADDLPLLHGIIRSTYIKDEDVRFKIIKFLVGKGVDTEAVDKFGNRPLFLAIESKAIESEDDRLKIVDLLIENKANINAKALMDYTPLIFSACKGRVKIVKYLIEKGSKVEDVSTLWDSTLHVVISSSEITDEDDRLKIVELLIENGADFNAKNFVGQTPFDCARRLNRDEIVQYFISKFYSVSSAYIEEKKGSDVISYKLKPCIFCKKLFKKILKCGGCKKACYCSTECQRKDWKRHKNDCKVLTVLEEIEKTKKEFDLLKKEQIILKDKNNKIKVLCFDNDKLIAEECGKYSKEEKRVETIIEKLKKRLGKIDKNRKNKKEKEIEKDILNFENEKKKNLEKFNKIFKKLIEEKIKIPVFKCSYLECGKTTDRTLSGLFPDAIEKPVPTYCSVGCFYNDWKKLAPLFIAAQNKLEVE